MTDRTFGADDYTTIARRVRELGLPGVLSTSEPPPPPASVYCGQCGSRTLHDAYQNCTAGCFDG